MSFFQKTESSVYAFPKPNIEWKTRTKVIHEKTISYTFGTGNPPEIALSQKEIDMLHTQLQGYVTSESERALKDLLENPHLPEVLSRSGYILDVTNQQQKADWAKFPPDLDMERMLIIDPTTGRKEFNDILFSVIYPAFSLVYSGSENVWKSCLGNDYSYAVDISKQLSTIASYYMKGKPTTTK